MEQESGTELLMPRANDPNTSRRIAASGPRLALAEFQSADLTAVHDFASDPKVCKYSSWGPNKLADTQAFLKDAALEQSGRLLLAVLSGHKVIGSASVWKTDEVNHAGEIGYTLHQDYWGQGLGTEVAKLLVNLGIQRFGLHRIEASCDQRNFASIRVLEKAGLQLVRSRKERAGQLGDRELSLIFAFTKGPAS